MMIQMSCSDVFFSSSIPLRKICTIRYPKHSLGSPWSILIANLALCLQLTAKHLVCSIAPSACLLYVPCICDIFALRKLLVPTWERYSALCDVTKRFLRLDSFGGGWAQFNSTADGRRAGRRRSSEFCMLWNIVLLSPVNNRSSTGGGPTQSTPLHVLNQNTSRWSHKREEALDWRWVTLRVRCEQWSALVF